LSCTKAEGSGRVCVYCGGAPVTAEHAWPGWIANYVPADKMEEKADHYHVFEDASGRQVQHCGRRYPFTTEVRCVCESCNTGWMHELETTAEYALGPLIRGDLTTLSGEPWRFHEWRLCIAATWAFKTAMMLEHHDAPEKPKYPARPDLQALSILPAPYDDDGRLDGPLRR
jgi:hypothetical protein